MQLWRPLIHSQMFNLVSMLRVAARDHFTVCNPLDSALSVFRIWRIPIMHISMHDGAGHEDLPTRSENPPPRPTENRVILRLELSHSQFSSEKPEQNGLVYFLNIYSAYIKPSIRLLVLVVNTGRKDLLSTEGSPAFYPLIFLSWQPVGSSAS